MSEPLRIEIRFPDVLDHQREFLDAPERIVVVLSGVKSGKTTAAALYVVREMTRRPAFACCGALRSIRSDRRRRRMAFVRGSSPRVRDGAAFGCADVVAR